MSEDEIESKIKNLKLHSKTDINILLLGATGVGKSTFINALANYLTYTKMKEAKNGELLVLIPSQFNIEDKSQEHHNVLVGGQDTNEFLQIGESATQDVKTYVFPYGNFKIRLIDTPGMGDTRGLDQDHTNCENILSYISNLHELHAICFLLKPYESRDTVVFNYCMNQILSRLDKSASDNIIFCFTNTRGSNYTAGDTRGTLKIMIEKISKRPPFVKIPFDKNIFCFDNEPFRYLAAIKKGIKFDSDVKERNKQSWNNSVEELWRLISYITGCDKNPPLKPHHVKNTNAVNEARRMIDRLSLPLAEITQLIHHNLDALERHEKILQLEDLSLNELKKNLYVPVITLELIEMSQPATVCTAQKCCEIYQVGGKSSVNYTQRCHDPCFLSNVKREIIGAPELMHCASINASICQKCGCDFRVHMHIYYMTKKKEVKDVDENVKYQIDNKNELIKSREQLIKKMRTKKEELIKEHDTIVKICATFTYFLQRNAITPFNDSYKDYIEYLIYRERSLGNLCDEKTLAHLQNLLIEYNEIKSAFDDSLNSNRAVECTPKDIGDYCQELYNLKYNGKKIKQLYECQKKPRNKEYLDTEIALKAQRSEKKKKDKKEKADKSKEDKKKDNKKSQPSKEEKGKQNVDSKKKAGNPSKNERGNDNKHSKFNRDQPPKYEDIQHQGNFQRPQYPRRDQQKPAVNFPQNASPFTQFGHAHGPYGQSSHNFQSYDQSSYNPQPSYGQSTNFPTNTDSEYDVNVVFKKRNNNANQPPQRGPFTNPHQLPFSPNDPRGNAQSRFNFNQSIDPRQFADDQLRFNELHFSAPRPLMDEPLLGVQRGQGDFRRMQNDFSRQQFPNRFNNRHWEERSNPRQDNAMGPNFQSGEIRRPNFRGKFKNNNANKSFVPRDRKQDKDGKNKDVSKKTVQRGSDDSKSGKNQKKNKNSGTKPKKPVESSDSDSSDSSSDSSSSSSSSSS